MERIRLAVWSSYFLGRAYAQGEIHLLPGSSDVAPIAAPTSSPSSIALVTEGVSFATSSPGPLITTTTTNNIARVQGVLTTNYTAPNNTISTRYRPSVAVPVDRTRLQFPKCPKSCTNTMFGDGWCNTQCYLPECGLDGEECKGWCAPDCKPGWVGDNMCDKDCFRPECNWDQGDCSGILERGDMVFPPPSHETFDYRSCVCPHNLLHNGKCDAECNTAICNWDGGDCRHFCAPGCLTSWLGDTECDVACFNEDCGYDKGDCEECSPGCRPDRIGNGICDGDCMTDSCHWDMGDCAGVCRVYPVDYTDSPFKYIQCRHEWTGDGSCDCFCMNEECHFDKGDCRGKEEECLAITREAEARQGGIYPIKATGRIVGFAGQSNASEEEQPAAAL